jgi:hypothetical protein
MFGDVAISMGPEVTKGETATASGLAATGSV